MNILVPDLWLREFLETKATAKDLQQYLSLSGPSVERVNKIGNETVYDIEITGNRPDSMSVLGIAREASAILPHFGIPAKLTVDPYKNIQSTPLKEKPLQVKKLDIKTDAKLNPRWTSIVLADVKVGPSPKWLKEKLEATGIRSLNNIVDITNFLMRAYGQPAHAFDYDEIKPKNGVPTMILRESRKGEKVRTLDGKDRILPGGDIVIEDGSGRLIDLCGIMGAENSSIKPTTKNVVLFLQTYDPMHIRRTSMKLAHRTEAAVLFEKGIDPALVMPALLIGADLIVKIAGGKPASKIYDFYPNPFKPYTVSASRTKVDSYLGSKLTDREIISMLLPLGFKTQISKESVTVEVPSFRRDITIDVDIIEEIARIYGYHKIATHLPQGEPPIVTPDKTLTREDDIKTRLRDWGFTELYTYSMISEKLMDVFGTDKSKTYKITNPLSDEWVYLRPHLIPSVLKCMKENLSFQNDMRVFELSMTYVYRPGDLPLETPYLIAAWTHDKFREAKGLAEIIFKIFGIDFSKSMSQDSKNTGWYGTKHLSLGEYGSVGVINQEILRNIGMNIPVTLVDLNFSKLVKQANLVKTYTPFPIYPPIFEDLSFIVPPKKYVGPMVETLKKMHPIIAGVTLLDEYENVKTFHITYQSNTKNLTADDVRPVREKLIKTAQEKFNVVLKTI